jgi:uncharacterized membrane protein
MNKSKNKMNNNNIDNNINIKRHWEIDVLRAISLILMIIYHIIYNLRLFGEYNINIFSPGLFYLQRIIGTSFLLLVGISLTLSYNKAKLLGKNTFLKYLKRGLIIFSWGMVITFISWIFYKQGFIRFGVLHLIGLGIILSYPLIKYKYLNLVLGILFIVIGRTLMNLNFNFSWLLWIGLMPKNFFTIDYYPLLPWYGIILIGIFVGNIIYPKNKCLFNISDFSNNKIIKGLSYIGKHSLLIYLIHQPILLGLMIILGII